MVIKAVTHMTVHSAIRYLGGGKKSYQLRGKEEGKEKGKEKRRRRMEEERTGKAEKEKGKGKGKVLLFAQRSEQGKRNLPACC